MYSLYNVTQRAISSLLACSPVIMRAYMYMHDAVVFIMLTNIKVM